MKQLEQLEMYNQTRLSSLMKTGIYRVVNGEIRNQGEDAAWNPICQSEKLRVWLMEQADRQLLPYIYKDEFEVCFICIKKGAFYELAGPMCTETLNRIDLHHFYQTYGWQEQEEKQLERFTIAKVLDLAGLLAGLLLGEAYEDQELLYANELAAKSRTQESQEMIRFDLQKEEEALYHHTYQEERKLLDSVRDGRTKDALRLSREMDDVLGRLSVKEINHWRNVAVVGITLCTRAAIESGISPAIAYRLSDFYIQKCDSCKDRIQLMEYRNHAVEELTSRVRRKQENHGTSNYIERCKDYVKKHYRKKIYLTEIAKVLGISSSYLSKLFKKECGICFQEYVNQIRVERAANLLLYSDETIAKIAEYVNFPSQSYLGKIFRQQMHMSPRVYRELNKPAEFFAEKGEV